MYFYNRENKIVFPVDVDKVYDCISEPVKILLGVLSVAGIHIVGIQISGSMSEDKPNTYLIAEINSELSKIQTDFFESIKLAANLKIPIMIEENILTFQGIKITKELLENSLAID
jgi:bifunctional DNase/RNase